MAKFGRFEFGKDQPREVYVGDRMTIEKGCVKILKGLPSLIDAKDEHLVAVIHLDRGQSMREIKTR